MMALFRASDRCFRRIERFFSRIAARRGWAVLIIFLLALGARLAVLPIEPIPAPGVHDEFSYLLMADTFAHGRLTNPTHPMWVHFESEAINQRPTYCSAFYPAQGAFLALGQVVVGNPFWGVWLSTGLMCAAICWALQGWMPPTWAFFGGILALLRFGVFSYWADSYWGGSVAALGGALVLGALPRIKRRQRIPDAVLMGAGFAILANSRPYEGLFYSIPFLAVLAAFVFGGNSAFLQLTLRRIILPLSAVMVLTFAFMGYYFWRTTGNPLRPPYLVNVATYMQEPQFIWGKMGPPLQYNHPTIEAFYRTHHGGLFQSVKKNIAVYWLIRAFQFWEFFFGPLLTVSFFALCFILPYGTSFRELGAKTRFLLVLLVVFFIGLLLPVPFFPHYAAPITCAAFALALYALRRASIFRQANGFPVGVWVARGVGTACILSFVSTAVAMATGVPRDRAVTLILPNRMALGSEMSASNVSRQEIVSSLVRENQKYLVIVHREPGHVVEDEWVYNAADIDSSRVVWAREMNPLEDQQLIRYFKDRQAVLLDADTSPPQLRPYPHVPSQDSMRNYAKRRTN